MADESDRNNREALPVVPLVNERDRGTVTAFIEELWPDDTSPDQHTIAIMLTDPRITHLQQLQADYIDHGHDRILAQARALVADLVAGPSVATPSGSTTAFKLSKAELSAARKAADAAAALKAAQEVMKPAPPPSPAAAKQRKAREWAPEAGTFIPKTTVRDVSGRRDTHPSPAPQQPTKPSADNKPTGDETPEQILDKIMLGEATFSHLINALIRSPKVVQSASGSPTALSIARASSVLANAIGEVEIKTSDGYKKVSCASTSIDSWLNGNTKPRDLDVIEAIRIVGDIPEHKRRMLELVCYNLTDEQYLLQPLETILHDVKAGKLQPQHLVKAIMMDSPQVRRFAHTNAGITKKCMVNAIVEIWPQVSTEPPPKHTTTSFYIQRWLEGYPVAPPYIECLYILADLPEDRRQDMGAIFNKSAVIQVKNAKTAKSLWRGIPPAQVRGIYFAYQWLRAKNDIVFNNTTTRQHLPNSVEAFAALPETSDDPKTVSIASITRSMRETDTAHSTRRLHRYIREQIERVKRPAAWRDRDSKNHDIAALRQSAEHLRTGFDQAKDRFQAIAEHTPNENWETIELAERWPGATTETRHTDDRPIDAAVVVREIQRQRLLARNPAKPKPTGTKPTIPKKSLSQKPIVSTKRHRDFQSGKIDLSRFLPNDPTEHSPIHLAGIQWSNFCAEHRLTYPDIGIILFRMSAAPKISRSPAVKILAGFRKHSISSYLYKIATSIDLFGTEIQNQKGITVPPEKLAALQASILAAWEFKQNRRSAPEGDISPPSRPAVIPRSDPPQVDTGTSPVTQDDTQPPITQEIVASWDHQLNPQSRFGDVLTAYVTNFPGEKSWMGFLGEVQKVWGITDTDLQNKLSIAPLTYKMWGYAYGKEKIHKTSYKIAKSILNTIEESSPRDILSSQERQYYFTLACGDQSLGFDFHHIVANMQRKMETKKTVPERLGIACEALTALIRHSGYPTPQIEQQLNLSPNTLASHMHNIEISNQWFRRAEAIAGFLCPSEDPEIIQNITMLFLGVPHNLAPAKQLQKVKAGQISPGIFFWEQRIRTKKLLTDYTAYIGIDPRSYTHIEDAPHRDISEFALDKIAAKWHLSLDDSLYIKNMCFPVPDKGNGIIAILDEIMKGEGKKTFQDLLRAIIKEKYVDMGRVESSGSNSGAGLLTKDLRKFAGISHTRSNRHLVIYWLRGSYMSDSTYVIPLAKIAGIPQERYTDLEKVCLGKVPIYDPSLLEDISETSNRSIIFKQLIKNTGMEQKYFIHMFKDLSINQLRHYIDHGVWSHKHIPIQSVAEKLIPSTYEHHQEHRAKFCALFAPKRHTQIPANQAQASAGKAWRARIIDTSTSRHHDQTNWMY